MKAAGRAGATPPADPARDYSTRGSNSAWPDLSWVDEFWEQAGPYIFSREEDGILILPPNRVFKINATGAALIRHLKEGRSISSLFGNAPQRKRDRDQRAPGVSGEGTAGSVLERLLSVEGFFRSLAQLYQGDEAGAALERLPFTFDFSRLPILGEIAVTYRCNNRCLFCYAGCGPESGGGNAKFGAAGEVSTESWKRIIRIFKEEARIPFFSFTGGEPLLRKDLEELISYAIRLGLETNLVSNGTLAQGRRAESLYAAGLRTAQVSIEAPRADLHDFLAGRIGAFDETVRGIQALMEAGISVQTNTTITRANWEIAAAMPAFLASLGIRRFAMNMYIPAIPPQNLEDLSIYYDEIGPVVDSIRKAAYQAGLTFYWYSPTPFCHYNPIARGMGNKSCAAADGLISVAANGDLLPCSSWDEPIGNLLASPFGELWHSTRAHFFKHKQFAPELCKGCSSFTACQGACPLYWKAYGEGLLGSVPSRIAGEALGNCAAETRVLDGIGEAL